MATAAERLVEAEAALHRLRIGGTPVKVRDQNGEEVVYSRADLADLKAYIAELKAEIAGTPVQRGPIRPYFAMRAR